MASILAISAAFFYGLGMVLTRVGLRSSNMLTGVLISLIISLSGSSLLCMFAVPLDRFASPSVGYFVLAGILGPCIGQILLFEGIKRVGSSIAAPLYDIKPLFSAIAAVIILGESLTFSIVLATCIIIVGSAVISLEESGGQIEEEWSKTDLIFPVLAGMGFGVAHVLRKMGLNTFPEPLVGVAVQNAAALCFFLVIAYTQRNQQRLALSDKRAWTIFGLSGLSYVLGQISLFCALDLGLVVVVSPLSSVSPVFVLIIASIFLRKIERITWKIVLGTVFIIAGTVVLALFPHFFK